MPTAGESHWRNYEGAEEDDFVDKVVAELATRRIPVVRIHVAGDFYNCKYIRKWIEIVDRSPHVTFYAYTRSWRIARLQKDLKHLARRPNMSLWLSFDNSMDRPPKWPGCRTCYLSQADTDLPRGKVDLVFRDVHDKSVMKHTPSGNLICPVENGATPNMTCTSCRICWHPRFKPTASERQQARDLDTRELQLAGLHR